MGFLDEYCTFKPLTQELLSSCKTFDCNYPDLNDFFINESIFYSSQLLGKSYCFTLTDCPDSIVCAFTLSNDSIKTNLISNARKNKLNRSIPNQKRFSSYPAVLIGRLGVAIEFKGKGIGHELLDFIKAWFIHENNKTGCRFIVVDSYNETKPINYYKRNSFQFLFETEEEEKKYSRVKNEEILRTRLMYFDLIVLTREFLSFPKS
jgi:GNAT superfamily N-acetyltransferase